METKRVFLVSVICTLIICAVFLFTWQARHTGTTQPTPNAPKIMYIVREHGGKIAVFLPNDETPSQIMADPYVRDLPTADREMLQRGVEIYSAEQLQRLIEDLCG